MAAPTSEDAATVLALLETQGVATSQQLQTVLGKSQATVSRLLGGLAAGGVAALGRGKRARYGLVKPILGSLLGQQPLWRIDEHGHTEEWGTLRHLAAQQVHVQHGSHDWLTTGSLPWFLAPLRLEGFLGRLWARTTALATRLGGDDPSRWSAEQQLYAAIARVHDVPGALLLGDAHEFTPAAVPAAVPADDTQRAADYDRIADDVAHHLLPTGSSAGGEQPKFLSRRRSHDDDRDAWESLVVKFTPPRGTPFGERWHDLLHAEAIALRTLAEAGEPVAQARVVESARRTYIESVRFDRVGAHGRRHVVALTAAHEAFVNGPLSHWAASCDALAAQRRLSVADAQRVRLWRAFGRLIGNTDMHFGNISLFAEDIVAARFALAPCYDMLPMLYKPEPHRDDFGLAPLVVERPPAIDSATLGKARDLALAFWQRVSEHTPCSEPFRAVARENAARVAALLP
jgi:hypothetical protein